MREQVLGNIHMAQDQMVSRYNSKAFPLNLQVGDYVLLSMDPKGQGQKLQHKFEGPFVVHSIPSPHMVTFKDPTTNICRKDTVHMDRLKMAFVREPSPMPYFMDKVVTRIETPIPEPPQSNLEVTQATGPSQDRPLPTKVVSKEAGLSQDSASLPTPISRPKRSIRKPLRFRNSDHTAGDIVSSDSSSQFKIKRVIGQRLVGDDARYKVTLRGEPSHNSFWVSKNDLDAKARQRVNMYPPPLLA